MNILKKLVCALLVLTFIPVTGCSKLGDFKENLESRTAQRREQRKEDNKRSFSTMHDFEDYYTKGIRDALRYNDKKALKDLFCETVIENTYDIDEGLKYVFKREDWSDFTLSKANCSSRKEYGGEGHWEYVSCTAFLAKGNEKYKVFYSGYSIYEWKVDGKKRTVSENLGLTSFCIVKCDFKEGPIETIYTSIGGITHPGREKCDEILNLVLNYWDAKNRDGSYIDEMTDEALASVMTDNLKSSADKDELDAFINFIRTGSMSKKHEYFIFLRKQGGSVTITSQVRFELKDRCLTLLIKDGRIDGAVFSGDENEGKPESGRIQGFAENKD